MFIQRETLAQLIASGGASAQSTKIRRRARVSKLS